MSLAESTSGLTEAYDSVTSISESINKYVVRPSTYFGISGFVFEGAGQTTVSNQNEITDNVIENNTTIQDHIAIKPTKVTMTRYVGELFVSNNEIQDTISSIVTTLTPIAAYGPSMVSSMSNIQSTVTGSDPVNTALLSEADNLYGLFKNLNPFASKKQKAYLYFQALAQEGVTFSVETPFQYFTNMAIESISAKEAEETTEIAEFSLVLKQVNFASTSTTTVDPDEYQSRAKQQSASEKDGGKAVALESTASEIAR